MSLGARSVSSIEQTEIGIYTLYFVLILETKLTTTELADCPSLIGFIHNALLLSDIYCAPTNHLITMKRAKYFFCITNEKHTNVRARCCIVFSSIRRAGHFDVNSS